ncbi:hypothetical protein NTE_01068 [Candidatus Nitrososphaera evergladensis SR1]|uniref:Uncharacterized protein n=2 Tax=Nitrososphaera TaxID=497726 RepID=A0A075MNK6_9ARCH|nr:hypothetical protein NTE_01068 [Candidatus Nitrososphaera evergladensis SR1]
MLGVGAVIVAGLLLSISVGAYSRILAMNDENGLKPRCGRGGAGCSTAHVPPASSVHYPNLLIAGLLSGSFGIALLIVRRQEIEG